MLFSAGVHGEGFAPLSARSPAQCCAIPASSCSTRPPRPSIPRPRRRSTPRWRDGNYVLARDRARFVNHSCRPNSVPTADGFEIAIVDIAPGDQIINDYAETEHARRWRVRDLEPARRRRSAAAMRHR